MKKLTLYIVLFLLSGIALLSSCNPSYPKKEFKKGELFYTQNVTEDEVNKTGFFLTEMGYFTDERRISILLDKQADTFLIQIVVDKLYHTDTSYDYSFRALTVLAGLEIFNGTPTSVELSDRSLNVKRRIN